MNRRLLRVGVRLHPDKGMVRVHDLGSDPTSLQAPPPPGTSLVSVGYDQMWIGSLQDDVAITLLLEEWDTEPPSSPGPWEQEAFSELYLRGAVAVSTATGEPVLHGIRLVGGVGRYHLAVRARHRAEIARLYDDLLDRFRDGFNAEFQAALRALEGVEHYLVQFWPVQSAGPVRVLTDSPI